MTNVIYGFMIFNMLVFGLSALINLFSFKFFTSFILILFFECSNAFIEEKKRFLILKNNEKKREWFIKDKYYECERLDSILRESDKIYFLEKKK